ncbi:MAG: TlyA family RNA methyltransferase [Syntrophomonadaceae bacterium]|nr:TlyA family RNA methyltransferase [Syntrophomonadaceae bacterium]
MSRERADIRLYKAGLAPSREKARALILAGLVFADGQRVDKPGQMISESAELQVTDNSQSGFVSRGGMKLLGAIEAMKLDFADKIVLDVGASTGGFTDCALQHGARKVYAVDVGYGQLDWRLRQDPRVVVIERTNIRHVTPEDFPEQMDIATIDVSFISLRLVLPAVTPLLTAAGEIVALVKPQFEAGREQVGKKGVVKSPEIHEEVLRGVTRQAEECGLTLVNACYSPIKGPNGNIEFFLHLKKGAVPACDHSLLSLVVASAHRELGKPNANRE